jgi:hypothetical protein
MSFHTLSALTTRLGDKLKAPTPRDHGMADRPKLPHYRAHVLRMWIETSPHHPPRWRFSLEEVSSSARLGFADLDALTHHLLDLMEHWPETIELDETPSH